MTVTVFNQNATAYKTGDYPIFGGEEPALYDSINQPYPYFFELMEKLKELDWSQDDVDLTETRMDLLRCDVKTRELMLLNLAYQWSIDSIATSIPTLLAPFITNSEYGHVVARIGENENLHSVTYSNIVRQCVPNPQEVFDMVHNNDKVLERSEVIAKALNDLKEYGAKYTLGMVTFDECAPVVLKGLIAIYALERISFMSSFAFTFALAEQEYFVGAARLVQKILIDEMIHFETQRYALQDVMLSQPYWQDIFEKHIDECSEIVNGVVDQELSWNKYIFQDGRSIVGMNEGIANDWTRYCAQEVVNNLGTKQLFRKTVTCPLPWFEQDWMDLNSQQNANMEADNTNYMVSSVSREVSGASLQGLNFDDFGDGIKADLVEDTPVVDISEMLVVYSKPQCPFCVKLKEHLDKKGYEYTEVDVSEQEFGRKFLQDNGYKTVPQVFGHQSRTYFGDCTKFIETYP